MMPTFVMLIQRLPDIGEVYSLSTARCLSVHSIFKSINIREQIHVFLFVYSLHLLTNYWLNHNFSADVLCGFTISRFKSHVSIRTNIYKVNTGHLFQN